SRGEGEDPFIDRLSGSPSRGPRALAESDVARALLPTAHGPPSTAARRARLLSVTRARHLAAPNGLAGGLTPHPAATPLPLPGRDYPPGRRLPPPSSPPDVERADPAQPQALPRAAARRRHRRHRVRPALPRGRARHRRPPLPPPGRGPLVPRPRRAHVRERLVPAERAHGHLRAVLPRLGVAGVA